MPGKFNIGSDATLQIVTADGQLLRPQILTKFTFKQETIDLKSRPLNGKVIHERKPDGWSGNFDFDRAGPELDDYFAQNEADYYAGLRGSQVFITQTIREISGAISQYRFTGVAMALSDGGGFQQDEKVTQRIEWMASERKKVI